MAFDNLLYDRRGPRVTITLNRPAKINALNEPLTREEWTAKLEREGFKPVMQDWKAGTVWDRNRNR